MANPSMDRDLVAWLRGQLQEAQPDLLREMLATMVQELMRAEAPAALQVPSTVSVRASEPTLATATANGTGTPGPAPSNWPFPSCAGAATSRSGCLSLAGERSALW
jgi:hypothetical protein